MTKADLTLVYESADDKNFKVPGCPDYNTECDGIAYWTKKRPVTLVGAVALVRWQAQLILGGGWDSDLLQETLIFLQDKAILLSSLSPSGEKASEVEKLLEHHDHDSNCVYVGSGIWNCGTVDQS